MARLYRGKRVTEMHLRNHGFSVAHIQSQIPKARNFLFVEGVVVARGCASFARVGGPAPSLALSVVLHQSIPNCSGSRPRQSRARLWPLPSRKCTARRFGLCSARSGIMLFFIFCTRRRQWSRILSIAEEFFVSFWSIAKRLRAPRSSLCESCTVQMHLQSGVWSGWGGTSLVRKRRRQLSMILSLPKATFARSARIEVLLETQSLRRTGLVF